MIIPVEGVLDFYQFFLYGKNELHCKTVFLWATGKEDAERQIKVYGKFFYRVSFNSQEERDRIAAAHPYKATL